MSTKIIISIATYKKRYDKIKENISYILEQTLPYDKVILNVQDDLTDEQFDKFKMLESQSDKLEVVKRPAKWRSFNKFVHTYKEYPDSMIITMDDDIKYPNYFCQKLYDEYLKHPNCIICHEANPVFITGGKIENLMMSTIKLGQQSFNKYMSGCCLFPPNIFDNSKIALDDYDKFMELTNGTHDEIWLWVLSTLCGVQCVELNYTYSFDLDGIGMEAEDFALCKINGNPDNIKQYDRKINELYGNDLLKVILSKPVVFDVNRSNLNTYLFGLQAISEFYRGFVIAFNMDDSDDIDTTITKSMLKTFICVLQRYKWYNKVLIKHKSLR